jgi:6-phosphogluconolactonase (cycloisomerase 2 family)
MKTTVRIAGIGGLALAAAALIAGPASAAAHPAAYTHGEGSTNAGDEATNAVFVQTDNLSGNSIAVYDRTKGGALQPAGSYPTGGLGGALTGSVVDHLASQGSLALDRDNNLLYAVNAGSDTITVFGVHGDRLVRTQVLSSGGTFPVSIAVHGNLVYVLNARDGGTVQGFLRLGTTLIRIPAWHRTLGLDPTATPEFTHTPGQIAFTPDGARLVVTTKAASSAIDVFSVGFTGLSATPVVNSLPGTVPFAVTFDAGGHLVVAMAGSNAAASFTVNADGTLTSIAQVATGQAATCWIAGTGTSFYLSNAGSASLSGYVDPGDGTLAALGNTGTHPGTVDATVTADGRYLYVQTGASGVVDGYRINSDGSLTPVGSVTVPDSAGGEGIAAS